MNIKFVPTEFKYPFLWSWIVFFIFLATAAFHLNPDNFLADDAYFYLQIAHQISQGHGSTFHQITPTNGYHPLWMFFCAVGSWLASGDKALLLHLMGAFQLMLTAVSLYFLHLIGQKLQMRFWLAGAFVLTFVLVSTGGLRLFEAHLSILLQLAILYLFVTFLQGSRDQILLVSLGGLGGLLFLTRLDTIFILIPLTGACACMMIKESKKLSHLSMQIAALALPMILLISPYLAYNYSQFGHLMPISGAIKSTFPEAHFSLGLLGVHGKIAVLSAIYMLAAILLLRLPNAVFFAILLCGIASHAAYIASFSWGSQWYYTTAYLSAALASMQLLTSTSCALQKQNAKWNAFFSKGVQCSLLLLFAFSALISVLKSSFNFSAVMVGLGEQKIDGRIVKNPGKEIADLLKRNLKDDAVFVFDAPGVLAYYSGLKILPADGLINDFSYNQTIQDEGIESFLSQNNIHYYLGPLPKKGEVFASSTLKTYRQGEGYKIEVFTPIKGLPAGTFFVSDQDQIFTAPSPVRTMGESYMVALWKIADLKRP